MGISRNKALNNFLWFVIKQGWAAIFGGLMLLGIIITRLVDLPWLSDYDWLFLYAIAIQAVLLVTKLEKPHEVLTIALFHLVGLGMEIFKTSSAIGSWEYPGDAIFRVASVPLFSGFMYAAVGSYIARSHRVLHLEYKNYPKRIFTLILAIAIYANFFTHHYIYDFRYILFLITVALYFRTKVLYRPIKQYHSLPLLIGFALIAFFIWVAENVGTITNTWLYPDQVEQWKLVSIGKLGSWFLLMIISFIMVDFMRLLVRKRTKA